MSKRTGDALRPITIWATIGVLAAIDYVWAWFLAIKVNFRDDFAIALVGILLGIYLIYTKIKVRPRLAFLAISMAQFLALLSVTSVLTYLVAALDFPLIDRQLATLDRTLGFEWVTIFNWVKAHPRIDRILNIAYWSLPLQLLLVPIVLSATGRFERMHEFLLLFLSTLLLVTALSALLPAAGAWDYYGVADLTSGYYLADFHAARSGTLTELNLSRLTGIIQFPSFHAALGLILIFASRGIPLVFPLAIICNTLMVVSAPTHGGHHLVDVLAGLLVVSLAGCTIMTNRAAEKPRHDTGKEWPTTP